MTKDWDYPRSTPRMKDALIEAADDLYAACVDQIPNPTAGQKEALERYANASNASHCGRRGGNCQCTSAEECAFATLTDAELIKRLDKLASDMNRGEGVEVWVASSDHLLVRAAADALRALAPPHTPQAPTTYQLRLPLPDGSWSEWQNVISPWDGSRNPKWEYRPLYAHPPADNSEELEKLRERCEAYKGQVEAGAAEIARLQDALNQAEELAELYANSRPAAQPAGNAAVEALAEALRGLEYIAPAIPVLRTMFMTADLKLGAEKAAEMDASNKEAIKALRSVLAALQAREAETP